MIKNCLSCSAMYKTTVKSYQMFEFFHLFELIKLKFSLKISKSEIDPPPPTIRWKSNEAGHILII